MTDINTKFVTLIGTPLNQSFAARMQNAAYAYAGINMHYFYTEAGTENLGEIINGIRYMPSFAGAAITKPNKVKVMEYLDEYDPLCAKMGACNTVVKTPQGKLKGYNTDGIGFYRSLKDEAGIDASGKYFFCLGAGGSGRAICAALAYYGARKIYITSRTADSRNTVAENINKNFAPIVQAIENGEYSKITECDVIINATGVGMGKTIGQSPLPKEEITAGKLYFDACYNPEKTQFLIEAEKVGCKILNGLGMSLHQGAAQIELWTGKKAPLGAMREELISFISEINR